MPTEEFIMVKVPKSLAERVGSKMGQRFPSVDDSIVFLIEEQLKDKPVADAPSAEFSPEEKRAIEDRLKSLGYS